MSIRDHVASVCLGVALVFSPVFAARSPAATAFLRIDGIDGAIRDGRRQGWSQALSLNIANAAPKPPVTAGFEDLSVVKEVDRASPLLLLAALEKTRLATVTVEVVADDKEQTLMYRLTLENATISGVEVGPATDSATESPIEILKFRYDRVLWEFLPRNGVAGDDIVIGWDLEKEEPYRGGVPHESLLDVQTTCPSTVVEGESVLCEITMENRDPAHGVRITSLTGEIDRPTRVSETISGCATTLGPADESANAGRDFTSCSYQVQPADELCTGGVGGVIVITVVALAEDSDPVPLTLGGAGGEPIDNSLPHAIELLCLEELATPTPTPFVSCTPPPCEGGGLVCGQPKGCPGGCGTICTTPTPTPFVSCTPPPCEGGSLICGQSEGCSGGCGTVCTTPTPTPFVSCTPPPCEGGTLICGQPEGCPGGCGTICTTPTPTPTPTPFARECEDRGDGTCIDTLTGLMWEKKDDSGGIHDTDRSFHWSDTVTAEDGSVFDQFLDILNNRCDQDETVDCATGRDGDCAVVGGACGFAGYRDWRLPTVERDGRELELDSLVTSTGAPPFILPSFNTCVLGCEVKTTGCSCTDPRPHWSAVSNASQDTQVWTLDFSTDPDLGDSIEVLNKTGDLPARAVRGSDVPFTPTPTVSAPTSTPTAIAAKLSDPLPEAAMQISLDDVSGFPPSGVVQIDDELIRYSEIIFVSAAASGTVPRPGILVVAERGFMGTPIQSHGSDGVVTLVPAPLCPGDCNGDDSVRINELILGVNIALGRSDVSVCVAIDLNSDGSVRINELIRGVRSALDGCPGVGVSTA